MDSTVRIVSCNQRGEQVCGGAGKISTTKGDVFQVLEQTQDAEKTRALIRKVLSSGHRSVIEHQVFTLAFGNVSAFVEQFVIECRLASFTVKSRRYVDFRDLGYHVPEDLEGQARADYCAYMDGLFGAYEALVDLGVPKEDARFVLPYAFHSNFFCTLNARELARLIEAMTLGRGRGVPEFAHLARQLKEQLGEIFPSLELPEAEEDSCAPCPGPAGEAETPLELLPWRDAGQVELLGGTEDPAGLLRMAWETGHPGEGWPGVEAILESGRPRELEQLAYTFRIRGLTLSGLTHLARHRMQSPVFPPLWTVERGRVILPQTVEERPQALALYRESLERAAAGRQALLARPETARYRYYMLLSGNLVDVMTTMNARELALFLRLRCCNRAQWEIRGVAVAMLRALRRSCPEVFDRVGPSCYMTGRCPEGRLSCGQLPQMQARFSGELD